MMLHRQNNEDLYIFVVDTDIYAGNFERQMTAYVTGCVGDCGVGEKEAKMFKAVVPEDIAERIEDNIYSVADEHGCHSWDV